METKLTEITNKYHKFTDNQVLTHTQLNEFIDYFNDQDRISRVFLHGVGVVCGFQIELDANNQITISQGTGITTDGDVLKLAESVKGKPEFSISTEKITFSHFRIFQDEIVKYAFFRNKTSDDDDSGEVIPMWEILPKQTENSKNLKTFPNLGEMVVVLYLESYPKEGDLCTAIDCDNQGVEQVSILRVLLVSKENALLIAKKDSIFSKNNLIDSYFNLPQPAVRKVVLNSVNSSSYETLKQAYFSAISNDGVVKDVQNGILEIINNFSGVLQISINPTQINEMLARFKNLLNIRSFQVPFDVQYRYDFLKDIVETYNELRNLLLSIKTECNPNIFAFPKHLLLGQIDEINNITKHLRHEFYPSQTHHNSGFRLQAQSLFNRLFEEISTYEINKGEVKITPSKANTKLAEKAIPFYYNVHERLLHWWNYQKTQQKLEFTNLSYHTSALADLPHIKEPLAFCTYNHDFLRIEGHQGKDYRDVLEIIDEYKTKYGLSFDVKALSINVNSENINIDDYECEFEDLKVMLRAWKAEQDCVLSEVAAFFSSFSTAIPGANDKENELGMKRPENIISETGANRNFTEYVIEKPLENVYAKATYFQPMYKANTVIAENLNTKEDTVGAAIKNAIEKNQSGSANDIIAEANKNLAEKINTEIWKEKVDLKEFVVDNSVKLMAYTHVITQRMPDSIAAFDPTKIHNYKLSLNELCTLVKKLKASYQKVELSAGLKAFMGLLINQLSEVCCSGKKLEVLLEEVTRRKENILIQLQLSKFVEKHRGLEHKAGVQPGGTFILVYINKIKGTGKVASNSIKNSVSERVLPAGIVPNEFILPKETVATDVSFARSRNIFTAENSFKSEIFSEKPAFEKIPGFALPQPEIASNTVVADFSLPYMCCSACAPVNFIVQKRPVALRLEKDQLCLDNRSEKIQFDVSPADGEIQWQPETDAIKIAGNELVISASDFPKELIGKPISFTVNNQITDAGLTVYNAPVFEMLVPGSPVSNPTVTFGVNGKIEGANFLWEFGDGQTSGERNPTHTYILPVNNNEVTVRLTVISQNGICKKTVEKPIRFAAAKPTVEMKPTEFCANDKEPHSFIITPEGADVEIKGDGVQKTESGFVFVPANAKAGEVEFTCNGEPKKQTVLVFAAPKAAFTHQQIQNQLILTNNSENATHFIWEINGKIQEANNAEPIVINLTPNSPTNWEIRLSAAGAKVCPVNRTRVQNITTRFIDEREPVTNCVEEIKASILSNQKKHAKLTTDNNIVAEVWQVTGELYGGARAFRNGVLNHIDEFLSGKRNEQLDGMFATTLTQTAKQISGVNPLRQKAIYNALLGLFELQLQLFYSILACQKPEQLKASEAALSNVFAQIIKILIQLKQRKVIFSDLLKQFVSDFAKSTAEIEFIQKHLEQINSKKLI